VTGALTGEQLRSQVLPATDEIDRARRRLHLKALGIIAAVAISYAAMLAGPAPVPIRATAFPILVISLMMVATSIMHDANHGAFFAQPQAAVLDMSGAPRWVSPANQRIGFASDLLGVSSALWRIKHDVHHAHANVQGVDPDIDQGMIARLAPTQSRLWWHRGQHLYLWPLYGFLGIQWLLISDVAELRVLRRRRRIDGASPVPSSRTCAYIAFGKLVHVGWAIALPLIWYPWWIVAIGYLATSWCIGFSLAVIFQIAHCVDRAEFVDVHSPRTGDDYVWHQLRTTVNVASKHTWSGRLRSCVLGGLDYQIEHHLAPGVPHTAYAAMSVRLRQACERNGVEYRQHANIVGAITSHQRWLRALAR
jgi:linoleoyl-CoA desaturase